jgi:hypothetical protein
MICLFLGEHYRMSNYLAVKLSPSNLIYKDLFFDPATNKVHFNDIINLYWLFLALFFVVFFSTIFLTK